MRQCLTSFGRAILIPMLALCGFGLAAGCAQHRAPVAKGPTITPKAAPQGPVIVRLVSRHYSVVISAGAKSPVYTIQSASGDLLASNVTLDQLRHSRADLYDQLAPLISPEGSASACVQWAGE